MWHNYLVKDNDLLLNMPCHLHICYKTNEAESLSSRYICMVEIDGQCTVFRFSLNVL